MISGDAQLGAVAEIYGLPIASDDRELSIAEFFARERRGAPMRGDALRIGDVLLIGQKVVAGHVTQVGLQLADPEPAPVSAPKPTRVIQSLLRRGLAFVIGRA